MARRLATTTTRISEPDTEVHRSGEQPAACEVTDLAVDASLDRDDGADDERDDAGGPAVASGHRVLGDPASRVGVTAAAA